MIEFNPDGSIKLSAAMQNAEKEKSDKFKNTKCMLLKKEVVNFTAPKKCILHLKLSNPLNDSRFVEFIHKEFADRASVPSKITKLNEKEFEIEIGTHFKRCTDCCNLVKRYKEHLYDNLIEEKGNCTYEDRRSQNFLYEDYFE